MTKPASHTPGKWILHFGVVNPYPVYVDDKDNSCIALIESRGGLATTEEIKANGKLIAAAPDLLEALSGMIEMFQYDDEASTAGTDAYTAIVLAKAAIAKATGDQ